MLDVQGRFFVCSFRIVTCDASKTLSDLFTRLTKMNQDWQVIAWAETQKLTGNQWNQALAHEPVNTEGSLVVRRGCQSTRSMQIQIHVPMWMTSRTHLAGQTKQTYATIWKELFALVCQTSNPPLPFACSQGQHCTIPRARSDLGDWQLYPNRRPGLSLWMCCWMCCRLSSFIKCAGRAAKRRGSAGNARKILIVLSIFTISWPSSRSISFSRVILLFSSSWWLKSCGLFHRSGRDPFDPYPTGNLGETKAADTRFVSASISGMKLGPNTTQRLRCMQFVTSL